MQMKLEYCVLQCCAHLLCKGGVYLDMINPQADDSHISYAREEIKTALQTIVNAEPIVYNCILQDTKEYVVKQGFYLDDGVVKRSRKEVV